jgi:hypothetical protein
MLSLDDQPNVTPNVRRGYYFRDMSALPRDANWWKNPLSQWGDNMHRLHQAAAEGFTALEKTRAVGDLEGQITFVKEHITYLTDPHVLDEFLFGDDDASGRRWRIDQLSEKELPEHLSALNDTLFSVAYLQQWKMAFLIRHPAKAFPSLYRLLVEEITGQHDSEGAEIFFPAYMTLRWNRRLYDLATNLPRDNTNSTTDNPGGVTWPIVLDADDLMANPAVVEKFAAITGMDPSKVQTTWSSLPEEQLEKMTPRAQRMLSTLNASNGIILEKSAASVRIEDEVEKWKQEFGDAGAQRLENWVRAAMSDYEYLREKRLR